MLTARFSLALGLAVALPALPARAAAPTEATTEATTETGPAAVPAPMPTEHPSADHDAAMFRAKRLRMGGLVTFTVGASFVVIGGGIAGGYSTGAVGAKALWAGVGLAAAGVVPIIIGGAMLGAAKRKMTRLQNDRVASLRLAPIATRSAGGLMFGGRF